MKSGGYNGYPKCQTEPIPYPLPEPPIEASIRTKAKAPLVSESIMDLNPDAGLGKN